MKIVYNSDGSVKLIELSGYVNQNNNDVDQICVAIVGKEPSEYSATAYFTLPTGDVNFLPVSTLETFTIGDDPTEYHGKSFYLKNAQTLYPGVLSMSIEFVNAENTNQILFTYNTKITINPSNALPSDTDISLSEYNAIVQALAGKIETSSERVAAVDSGITALKVETYDTAVQTLTTHVDDTVIHVTSADKSTWNGHVENTGIHVTPTQKTNWDNHIANTTIHVTADDKTLWNGKSRLEFTGDGPADAPVRSFVTMYDNQGVGTTYQIVPASSTSTVPWANITGTDPSVNEYLSPLIFNTIQATNISAGGVLTATDYTKITNGKPTRIVGTVLTSYINPIVIINDGDSTYNYGKATYNDSTGKVLEKAVKINKSTRELSFGTDSIEFGTDGTIKLDANITADSVKSTGESSGKVLMSDGSNGSTWGTPTTYTKLYKHTITTGSVITIEVISKQSTAFIFTDTTYATAYSFATFLQNSLKVTTKSIGVHSTTILDVFANSQSTGAVVDYAYIGSTLSVLTGSFSLSTSWSDTVTEL